MKREARAVCACMAARHVARLLTRLYDEELRDVLTAPQFGLLSMLEGYPDSKQAVLAEALAFDKATLSRNLKLLKREGWIESAVADDRRERGYHLTPAGARRLRAAKPAWARAQTRLREAMTNTRWLAMWQTFESIRTAASRPLAASEGQH